MPLIGEACGPVVSVVINAVRLKTVRSKPERPAWGMHLARQASPMDMSKPGHDATARMHVGSRIAPQVSQKLPPQLPWAWGLGGGVEGEETGFHANP